MADNNGRRRLYIWLVCVLRYAWWKGWDDKYCIALCAATLAPGATDSGVQIPGVQGE